MSRIKARVLLLQWLGILVFSQSLAWSQPAVGVDATMAADDQADMAEWDVPPDTPASLDDGLSINPILLQPLRDNTIGLEYRDRPAYFYGLWLCQQLDPKLLTEYALAFRNQRQAASPKYANKKSSEFPQFVDVFQHPQEYRGKPVVLHGYFRKLIQSDAGPNDLQIDQIYEGWFYNDDSQGNPAVVVFTQKPEGLPVGGDITEEVRFAGYFLKMYGYQAQDTTRKAPLFVAGTVQWYPSRAANERPPAPMWIYVALTAFAVATVWAVWTASRSRSGSYSRFDSAGRSFDEFPPQEFLGDGNSRPIEPHH
ncbi:hypothetical protein GC163_16330 [bacterium]|nr:hypothetical protein [bacterium]